MALISTGSVLSDTPLRNLLADGIENSCCAKESLHKLHMWENMCGNWSLFRAPLTGPTISCQFFLSLWFPFHNWRTFRSTFAGANFVKHRRNDTQFSLSENYIIYRSFIWKWLYAILAHSQNPQQPTTLAETYLKISLMVPDIQNISHFRWNLQILHFPLLGLCQSPSWWASWPLAGRLVVTLQSLITPNHI